MNFGFESGVGLGMGVLQAELDTHYRFDSANILFDLLEVIVLSLAILAITDLKPIYLSLYQFVFHRQPLLLLISSLSIFTDGQRLEITCKAKSRKNYIYLATIPN
jgi:hypothetical protein